MARERHAGATCADRDPDAAGPLPRGRGDLRQVSIVATAVLPLLGGRCGSVPPDVVAAPHEGGRTGRAERGRSADPAGAGERRTCDGGPVDASLHQARATGAADARPPLPAPAATAPGEAADGCVRVRCGRFLCPPGTDPPDGPPTAG